MRLHFVMATDAELRVIAFNMRVVAKPGFSAFAVFEDVLARHVRPTLSECVGDTDAADVIALRSPCRKLFRSSYRMTIRQVSKSLTIFREGDDLVLSPPPSTWALPGP